MAGWSWMYRCEAVLSAALDKESSDLASQRTHGPGCLCVLLQETSLSALNKGMRALQRELSERTGQLQKLIRTNFDRFISCKVGTGLGRGGGG